MRFRFEQFTWDPIRKTLTAEMSDLGIKHIENLIHVKGKSWITFCYNRTDKDASGEDIYGWWFDNRATGIRLLIIND